MKKIQLLDHTADVGIEVAGQSLAELFEAFGEGLGEIICPRRLVSPERTVRIEVAADDIENLAVDFLSRLLYVIEVDRFLVHKVAVPYVGETNITADIYGETYDPARHEWTREVKAVTYHQLKIEQDGDWWKGRVIFDL